MPVPTAAGNAWASSDVDLCSKLKANGNSVFPNDVQLVISILPSTTPEQARLALMVHNSVDRAVAYLLEQPSSPAPAQPAPPPTAPAKDPSHDVMPLTAPPPSNPPPSPSAKKRAAGVRGSLGDHEEEHENGTIVNWNDEKGFGFVHPEKGGDNLFCHLSGLADGPGSVWEGNQGDQVTFCRKFNDRKGDYHAVAVRVVRPGVEGGVGDRKDEAESDTVAGVRGSLGDLEEEHENGTIVNWNDGKGFGFVRPKKGGDNLFCHLSGLADGPDSVREGDQVSFCRKFNDRKGNYHAVEVRVVQAGVEGSPHDRKDEAESETKSETSADRERDQTKPTHDRKDEAESETSAGVHGSMVHNEEEHENGTIVNWNDGTAATSKFRVLWRRDDGATERFSIFLPPAPSSPPPAPPSEMSNLPEKTPAPSSPPPAPPSDMPKVMEKTNAVQNSIPALPLPKEENYAKAQLVHNIDIDAPAVLPAVTSPLPLTPPPPPPPLDNIDIEAPAVPPAVTSPLPLTPPPPPPPPLVTPSTETSPSTEVSRTVSPPTEAVPAPKWMDYTKLDFGLQNLSDGDKDDAAMSADSTIDSDNRLSDSDSSEGDEGSQRLVFRPPPGLPPPEHPSSRTSFGLALPPGLSHTEKFKDLEDPSRLAYVGPPPGLESAPRSRSQSKVLPPWRQKKVAACSGV